MDALHQNALVGSVTFAVALAGSYFLRERVENKGPIAIAHALLHLQPVGNELRITEIRVRAGALVDRIEFVYSNGTVAVWGGEGGTPAEPFVLEEGEFIVGVQGRRGTALDSVQFITSSGRVSPEYGGEGGGPYSLIIEEPIGGLIASTSARGWLRELRGVVTIPEMRQDIQRAGSAPPPLGFVRYHQARVRRNLLHLLCACASYCLLLICVYHHLFLDVIFGPFPLSPTPSRVPYFISLPPNATLEKAGVYRRSSFFWDDALPVFKTLIAGFQVLLPSPFIPQVPLTGALIESKANVLVVDTEFNRWLCLGICALLCGLLGWAMKQVLDFFLKGRDPALSNFARYAHTPQEMNTLIQTVEDQINQPESTLLTFGEQVAVTQDYIVKSSAFAIEFAPLAHCQLASGSVTRRYVEGEVVDLVKVTMAASHRGLTRTFSVQLPSELYQRLETTLIQRLTAVQRAIQEQKVALFEEEFVTILRERQAEGHTAQGAETDCLGGCGRKASVKITKRCASCPERMECYCEPTWCHACVLRWWVSQNQTRIEMGQPFEPRWQGKCPTCRAYFCLNDVLPLEGVPIDTEEEGDDLPQDEKSGDGLLHQDSKTSTMSSDTKLDDVPNSASADLGVETKNSDIVAETPVSPTDVSSGASSSRTADDIRAARLARFAQQSSVSPK